MSNQNNPYADVTVQPLLNQPPQQYPNPSVNNRPPVANPSFNNQGYNPNPSFAHNHNPSVGHNPNPSVGGYNPNPSVGGGYAPPVYPQGQYPPPPPGFQGGNPVYVPGNQVFYVPGTIPGSGRGLVCPVCRHETDNIPRKRAGCVTWSWCICLFCFSAILCFIPFCVDSCKDTELLCVKCNCVKSRQQANCC